MTCPQLIFVFDFIVCDVTALLCKQNYANVVCAIHSSVIDKHRLLHNWSENLHAWPLIIPYMIIKWSVIRISKKNSLNIESTFGRTHFKCSITLLCPFTQITITINKTITIVSYTNNLARRNEQASCRNLILRMKAISHCFKRQTKSIFSSLFESHWCKCIYSMSNPLPLDAE